MILIVTLHHSKIMSLWNSSQLVRWPGTREFGSIPSGGAFLFATTSSGSEDHPVWELWFSGTWNWVTGWVVLYILKGCSAFIFWFTILWMLETIHLMTQHHIPMTRNFGNIRVTISIPHLLSYTICIEDFYPGDTETGTWCNSPLSSSTGGKETVELYLPKKAKAWSGL
jgi:hypothetical protein